MRTKKHWLKNSLLISTFILVSSVSFYSCSETITPVVAIDQQYDWSTKTIPVDNIRQTSSADANNFFVINELNGYRVSEGVTSQIDFQDPVFTVFSHEALSKDYAVFTGYRAYGENATLIKIYDNGVIRPYEMPAYKGDFLTRQIYIIGKDNFLITHEHYPVIFHFQNGNITQYTIPDDVELETIGKANGNIYIFSRMEFTGESFVYKFTGSGFTKVPVALSSYWPVFNVNDNFIRIIQSPNYWYFSYFTEESGWKYLTTYNPGSDHEPAVYLTGSSANNFTVISYNEQTQNLNATSYNSLGFYKQTNFPALQQGNFPPWRTKSEYKNNTLLYCFNTNGGILIGKEK